MPDDKIRKVAEEGLERLSAELEGGKSEGLKRYLEKRDGSIGTAGETFS